MLAMLPDSGSRAIVLRRGRRCVAVSKEGPRSEDRDTHLRREHTMANDESLELPLRCPLIVDGEEGKATGGREFARENPADVRQVATLAAQGTQEDARAAIDAARRAFDGNAGNW